MFVPGCVLGVLLSTVVVAGCVSARGTPPPSEPPALAPPPPALAAGAEPPTPMAPPPSTRDVPFPAPEPVAPAAPPPAPVEIAAVPSPEAATIAPVPPLTADAAIEVMVERAPLPPEARLLARTMRPTLTAEYEDGYWLIAAGALGRWRVAETTWQVEPADSIAELWEIQSRLDLR